MADTLVSSSHCLSLHQCLFIHAVPPKSVFWRRPHCGDMNEQAESLTTRAPITQNNAKTRRGTDISMLKPQPICKWKKKKKSLMQKKHNGITKHSYNFRSLSYVPHLLKDHPSSICASRFKAKLSLTARQEIPSRGAAATSLMPSKQSLPEWSPRLTLFDSDPAQ